MNNSDIKNFRIENELTQKDLSNILGYKDLTAIQKIESGQTKVPVLVARVLRMIKSKAPEKRKKFIKDFVG